MILPYALRDEQAPEVDDAWPLQEQCSPCRAHPNDEQCVGASGEVLHLAVLPWVDELTRVVNEIRVLVERGTVAGGRAGA